MPRVSLAADVMLAVAVLLTMLVRTGVEGTIPANPDSPPHTVASRENYEGKGQNAFMRGVLATESHHSKAKTSKASTHKVSVKKMANAALQPQITKAAATAASPSAVVNI